MNNAQNIVRDMIGENRLRCEKCNTEITKENFWAHKHHQYADDKKGGE